MRGPQNAPLARGGVHSQAGHRGYEFVPAPFQF
jgi:hypothetical protein